MNIVFATPQEKLQTGSTTALLVFLKDELAEPGRPVHVAAHPPATDRAFWGARIGASVTTLCGIVAAPGQAIVLSRLSGVPCEGCVSAGVLGTLIYHGVSPIRSSRFGAELRGYQVEREFARAALALLAERGTPAPALVDDRTPDSLILLTVKPYDGPLPWPDTVWPVTKPVALPDPASDAGSLRWHHLPDDTRLAGDLDLCACLVAAAHDLGHRAASTERRSIP